MAAATAGWGTGLRLVWMSRYHWLLLLLLLLTLLLFFFVVIFFALPLVILCFVCSLHSPLLHSFRRPCAYSLSSFRWFSCCRRCVATVFSSTPLTFSFVILNLTLRYSVRWYYGFERSSSQLLCLLRPQPNEATAEANVTWAGNINRAAFAQTYAPWTHESFRSWLGYSMKTLMALRMRMCSFALE